MARILQLVLLLGSISMLSAQKATVFNNVTLGESLDVVSKKLQNSAVKLYVVNVEEPSFPLSQDSEEHLICLKCKAGDKTVEEVVFTFADDKLSLIQAQGNALEALTAGRKDKADKFMKYQAYWDDLVVLNEENDRVWIMSPESAHPNLYAWDNPYLPINGGKEKKYDLSVAIPAYLEMGGALDKLKPALEQASDFTFLRELPPGDPTAQIQIDCFGLEYGGFPRKFEARFGDGKLNMVWILTARGEENRLRQLLIEEFGNPIYKNEAWEVFDDWQVYLRKDKPEILLLTAELGKTYKKDYFGQ